MDCGPSCLAMIARYHGQSFALPKLRTACRIDRQGVSFAGMSTAAEERGFRCLSALATFQQLREHAFLPCIVHWQQNHFVVVHRIDRKKVHVADPGSGHVSYTHDEFIRHWASNHDADEPRGAILMMEPTQAFHEIEGEKDTSREGGFRLLIAYLSGHSRYLRQLMVGVVAAALLQLLLPFLSQAVVDVGIGQQDLGFIQLMLIAQLALIVGRTLISFTQRWTVLHLSMRVDINMVSDFLAKLMRLPLSYFDTKMTGDLMQRVDDHARIQRLLANTTLSMLSASFTLLVFGIALMYFSALIFGVYLIGSVIYVSYLVVFLRRRRDLDHRRFQEMSTSQNLLIETIRGMPEIKLNGAEREKRWDWERVQARIFQLRRKGLALDQYQQGGAMLINEVANAVMTIMAAHLVVSGSMTLGGLLATQYMIGQLNTPLNQMVSFLHDLQDAKLSLDRLGEIHTEREEGSGTERYEIPDGADIVLENVSFSYSGGTQDLVLNGLDLKLPYGKVTAIVGSSGSGKTTLMKMLLRFYEAQTGRIAVGRHDVTWIEPATWREHCGVVMQDGHVFSDSIAANVALGQGPCDRARLLHALDVACIREVVDGLPMGVETQVGRDGIGLSQGQKQRLLIARAVYKDPRYLFFDEATSALDAETERRIVRNLDAFFQGRTVVVIAHRLSTVRNADQIVVMEHGQIIEQGAHDALVHAEGRYFDLVKNQLELGG